MLKAARWIWLVLRSLRCCFFPGWAKSLLLGFPAWNKARSDCLISLVAFPPPFPPSSGQEGGDQSMSFLPGHSLCKTLWSRPRREMKMSRKICSQGNSIVEKTFDLLQNPLLQVRCQALPQFFFCTSCLCQTFIQVFCQAEMDALGPGR